MHRMEDKIINKLAETEQKHSVKIIYAIESGSRGWGFASPDSDYDCRFIYVQKQDWYLSVEEGKDFIEYPADKVFDINGWDIKKALKQLRKSNPVLTEWLSSPIVYIENKECTDLLRKLAADYFHPVAACYHYLNLAKKSLEPIREQPQAKIKKYFYVLRPLACCQYILQQQKIPPMGYAETMAAIPMESVIRESIHKLLEQKETADESFMIDKIPVIYDYLETSLQECEIAAKAISVERNKDLKPINETFREIIKKAWLT